MPKLLHARPALDAHEAHQVRNWRRVPMRQPTGSSMPRLFLRSWEGARTTAIAAELHCHVQTVRERIQRSMNAAWRGWACGRGVDANPG